MVTNFSVTPHQALTSTTVTTENIWHQRFGHINLHDLLLLQKQGMVDALPTLRNEHTNCEGVIDIFVPYSIEHEMSII